MEWKQGEFTVTDQRADLDIETIHNFLRESYWAKGIPMSIVEKAVQQFALFWPVPQFRTSRVWACGL
jgi:hypothetical protein